MYFDSPHIWITLTYYRTYICRVVIYFFIRMLNSCFLCLQACKKFAIQLHSLDLLVMFKKQMCLFLILAAVFTALFCLGYYGQFFPGHISEHETLIAGQSLNSQDVSSFDESDLVRNYRLNVDNDHDVLVFLHMQKTGGTTFGRHLVKDLNVTHPCVCYRRRKRCDCQNANNRNWLFSRYSTGWSCGLHADWTELNDCVDSMLNRMERKQRLRRFVFCHSAGLGINFSLLL